MGFLQIATAEEFGDPVHQPKGARLMHAQGKMGQR